MPEYRAKADLFVVDRLIRPGETFKSDLVPGRNWEPIDDKAKAAVEAHFGSARPAPVPEPVGEPPVEIEGWRDLHHEKQVKLAKKLPGEFIVPDGKTSVEAARELLEAEEQRRAAQAQG